MSAFSDQVGAFLAAPKELGPPSAWQQQVDGAEWRAFYGISIGGQLTGSRLEMSVYPALPGGRFMIGINFPPLIMRISVDQDAHRHDNHEPPSGVPRRVVGSRVYHWTDNRDRIRPGTQRHLIARPLDVALRQWDNALRSLCAEAGIDIAGVVLESYPRRLTLFGPQ